MKSDTEYNTIIRKREREARAYNPQNNLNNKSEINVLVENR